MHSSTWKKHERKAARLFGAERNVGSGCQGRADKSRSDSVHGRLFIECKSLARSFVRTLMNETRELARKENKIPVLSLREKGKPGAILCVREQDFADVVVEWLACNATNELHARIVTAIRERQGITDPGEIVLPAVMGDDSDTYDEGD